MTRTLTPEERERLLTQANLRKMQDQPELVPDFVDLRNQIWKELPGNPYDDQYAKPWVLDVLDGTSGSLGLDGAAVVGSGLALSASLMSTPNPYVVLTGGVIGVAAGGIKLVRDGHALSRQELGKQLLDQDHGMVTSMVSNTWAFERALREIASNPGADPAMRNAAGLGLARLTSWRKEKGLPDVDSPIELVLTQVSDLGGQVSKASAAAALKHNPATDRTRFERELLTELERLADDASDIKESLQPLWDDLQERMKEKAQAAAQAELERTLGEVVAAGQILGLIVGLKDARRGAAITTIFEQGAVAYKAFRAIDAATTAGKAIQLASIASGLGAVFAIAGTLSAFGSGGGGGGPDPTALVMSALQSIMDGINRLGEQIQSLSTAVRDLARRTDLNFAELDLGMARITAQLSRIDDTLRRIRLEDTERELFDALRDFRSDGSGQSAVALLKRAYAIGLSEASRDTQTGEDLLASQLARRVWNLADELTPQAGLGTEGLAPTGGVQLLSMALELYPSLLARGVAAFMATNRDARHQVYGDSLRVDSGLDDPLSRMALAQRRAIHPRLAAHAVGAAVVAGRHLLLRPDKLPEGEQDAALSLAEMLRDTVRVANWPMRAAAALGSAAAAEEAAQAYARTVEALLDWTSTTRMASSTLLTKWYAPNRLGMLIGASGVTEFSQRTPGPGLSVAFDSDALDSGNVVEGGAPVFGSAIYDDRGLSAAFLALDIAVRSGATVRLESIRAWVDNPMKDQPEWFGSGDFHEQFQITVQRPGEAKARVWFFAEITDPGLFGPQSLAPYMTEVDRHTPFEDYPIVKWRYEAPRGRMTTQWEDDQADVMPNTAPFGDEVFNALDACINAVRDDGEGQCFFQLADELRARSTDFSLYLGELDDLQGAAQACLFDALRAELQARLPKTLLLPAPLQEGLSQAWLNLVSTGLASLDATPALTDALHARVKNTPPLVRAAEELVTAGFVSTSVQEALWGWRLRRLITLQEEGPASSRLEVALVSSTDFEALLQVGRWRDLLPEDVVLAMCKDTKKLRVRPPAAPPTRKSTAAGISASNAMASSLPHTHRAMAMAREFSLMQMQLAGWNQGE